MKSRRSSEKRSIGAIPQRSAPYSLANALNSSEVIKTIAPSITIQVNSIYHIKEISKKRDRFYDSKIIGIRMSRIKLQSRMVG